MLVRELVGDDAIPDCVLWAAVGEPDVKSDERPFRNAETGDEGETASDDRKLTVGGECAGLSSRVERNARSPGSSDG